MGRRAGDFGVPAATLLRPSPPRHAWATPTAGTCGCLHQPAKGQVQTAGLPTLST